MGQVVRYHAGRSNSKQKVIYMRKRFLALFSGFPDHHFSDEITKRLREELTQRKSIVFITACPLEYEQNDDDCEGMYEMFAEQNLPFEEHCVIDKRSEPSIAKECVKNALHISKSCIQPSVIQILQRMSAPAFWKKVSSWQQIWGNWSIP